MFKLANSFNTIVSSHLVKKTILNLAAANTVCSRSISTTQFILNQKQQHTQSQNTTTSKQNDKNLIVNPLKHEDFFQINDIVNLETLFK